MTTRSAGSGDGVEAEDEDQDDEERGGLSIRRSSRSNAREEDDEEEEDDGGGGGGGGGGGSGRGDVEEGGGGFDANGFPLRSVGFDGIRRSSREQFESGGNGQLFVADGALVVTCWWLSALGFARSLHHDRRRRRRRHHRRRRRQTALTLTRNPRMRPIRRRI